MILTSPSPIVNRIAATLSFEDAYLISLGNASGSPKSTSFSTFNPSPHYQQQTFLSTPPGDQGVKVRSGSLSGSSPMNGHVTKTGTQVNTPSSLTSPSVPSFGESGSSKGSSATHRLSMQSTSARVSPKMQHERLHPQQPSNGQIHPMGQSTLMMFSPDGDNEVDMPGSASVLMGHGPKAHEPRSSGFSAAKKPQGSTLPQGAVFPLDDDFLLEDGEDSEFQEAAAANEAARTASILSSGRSDNILGPRRSRPSGVAHGSMGTFLEQEETTEDDYDDGSLI